MTLQTKELQVVSNSESRERKSSMGVLASSKAQTISQELDLRGLTVGGTLNTRWGEILRRCPLGRFRTGFGLFMAKVQVLFGKLYMITLEIIRKLSHSH